MNPINDIGIYKLPINYNNPINYLFVIRSYFFSLFHFLWFKFKRFIQKVFCEKGALKFPRKQLWALENVSEGAHFTVVLNITKEELLHGNFRRALPAYLWYNFFSFTTDTLKIDGTEESLHSTLESEEEENDTSISNL